MNIHINQRFYSSHSDRCCCIIIKADNKILYDCRSIILQRTVNVAWCGKISTLITSEITAIRQKSSLLLDISYSHTFHSNHNRTIRLNRKESAIYYTMMFLRLFESPSTLKIWVKQLNGVHVENEIKLFIFHRYNHSVLKEGQPRIEVGGLHDVPSS